MTDSLSSFLLFIAGIASGFINVNAGGGSSITLPVLIFLGLDASVANGTNRVAIIVQNASAVYAFKKENFQQFPTSIKLSLFTLPGAIIGALISVRISNELFETILGVVMIGIIITMVVPTKKKIFEENTSGKEGWVLYTAMFGIGFYGGFIQVGVGFILMAALHYIMRLNLIYVNMHKVFIVFIYTLPTLLIFIFTDNVNWFMGLILAFGNALGAWWGAKMSIKKGDKFIKVVLIISVGIMAIKLLGVF
ncbi:MAG: sulfite exporter TauE/SafE family protein [Bacteroidetes bacterium]|nr:sulfite exporter TauE/SafE family protein [Bacteroidota bacterium]